MTTGVGGIGGELVALPGVVLPLAGTGPIVDRCRRLGGLVEHYRLRRALSGILFESVDVIAGSVIHRPENETDFALRGRLPLRWARHYSSARSTIGLLGGGWRTDWEITLRKADDQLIYTDEYGRAFNMPFPERGSLVVASLGQLQFAHLPDGRMIVADLTPLYRVFGDFDANGLARLKYVEDLNRQRIGCIWDDDGRLLRMRGTCGHELRMHYDAPGTMRLSAIECVDGGSAGVLVRYGYSPNGELTEVRNRLGDVVRRFAYRDGRIVEDIGPLGMTTRYRWQVIDGVARVLERATSEGAHERFAYDVDHRLAQVTDVFGHHAVWLHDERGNVTSHTDFDGRHYAFDYGGADAPVILTLPGERTVRVEYDSLGRVSKETDPAGRVRTTQYAFASREPSVVTMSDGRTWMWVRNERLQCVRYQMPSGETVRVDYDADGFAVCSTDAQGLATRFTYNRWGQLTQRVARGGGAIRYEHDANGHVVGVTDALGAITRIQRDVLGRPLAVTRPDGHVERHVWNVIGQRIAFVGVNGLTRHWQRDRRGNVVRFVDEEGHAILREYDAHGRLVRIESETSATMALAWGARDCLSITDADGMIRRFDYTDAGWIHSITSQAGTQQRREAFAYDALGRLVGRDTRDGRYTYRYTAHGLLASVGRVPTEDGERLGIEADEIQFEYDAGGRPIVERTARSELRYTYDAVGRVVATVLPQGQTLHTRRYETGDIALVELGEQTITTLWYDAMRRLIARTLGDLAMHIRYSPVGRPIKWCLIASGDPPVRASPTERDRQLWREADYGVTDDLVRMADGAAGQTWYDYDRRGCLLRCVSEPFGIEYFTWDAAYNLLEARDGSVFPATHADHRVRERRGYCYDYDAWGRLVRRSGRDHPLSLEWDDEDHLIVAHRSGRSVRYRYDALGRRIAKHVEVPPPRQDWASRQEAATHSVTRYVWQGSRLLQEQHAGVLRTYLYQPEPDGTIGFAPLARVDQTLDAEGKIGTTQVYHYHTDAVGTAVTLTDEAGNAVWRGRHRAWGEPVARTYEGDGTVAQPLRYAGQYADDETTLHYNGRRFYEPAAGRYISPDRTRAGGISPYRYVSNPLTWCNPLARATPVRFPHVVAAHPSNDDLVPDPAQQIAGVIGQLDDIPSWDPFER